MSQRQYIPVLERFVGGQVDLVAGQSGRHLRGQLAGVQYHASTDILQLSFDWEAEASGTGESTTWTNYRVRSDQYAAGGLITVTSVEELPDGRVRLNAKHEVVATLIPVGHADLLDPRVAQPTS
jgi:hypothetical protein